MKRRLAVNFSVLILVIILLRSGEARGQGLKERLARKAALNAAKSNGQSNRRVARLRSPASHRARRVKPLIFSVATRHRIDPHLLWTVVHLDRRTRREGRAARHQKPRSAAIKHGAPETRPTARRVEALARRLRRLTLAYDGRPDLVLASYHAGESAVDAYLYGRTVRLDDDRLINQRRLKTDGVPPYRRTQNYVARGLKIYARLEKRIIFPSNMAPKQSVCAVSPVKLAEEVVMPEILPATANLTRPRFVNLPPKLEIVAEEDLFYDPHSGARFVIGTSAEDYPAESPDPAPDFYPAPFSSDDFTPQPQVHAESRVRTIYGGAFTNGAGHHSF